MPDEPTNNGGEGGGPDRLTRSEMRLLERAIKQRFELTDKGRKEVPAEMEKIATGKRMSPRNKIAAARVLVAMDAVNVAQEKQDSGSDQPIFVQINTIEAVKPVQVIHANGNGTNGTNGSHS